MNPLLKKILATAAAVVLVGFFAQFFLGMLQAAELREGLAACKGLKPDRKNSALFGPDNPLPIPAPDFKVQDAKGNMRSLSEFRGKVVFLNFWATWCPPCIDEVPAIEDLQAQLGTQDFVVLALASNQSWEDIYKFFPEGRRPDMFKAPKQLTNMTVMLDPPGGGDAKLGTVAKAWGVPALPETFLIDREGKIRYYYTNKRDWHSPVALTCMRSLIAE